MGLPVLILYTFGLGIRQGHDILGIGPEQA
jgi:hypothetical protein